jgi:hypothetical protein
MGSCVGVGVLGAIFNSVGSNDFTEMLTLQKFGWAVWIWLKEVYTCFLAQGTGNAKAMKIICPCNN